MLKIIKECWEQRKDILREKLELGTNFNSCGYDMLVALCFDVMFNYDKDRPFLNVEKITEIDNGDYQGFLLYLIPFNTYQPSEHEYLMTYVGYGSCSGCDTLQGIQGYSSNASLTEKQVNEFMVLCKDILTNTIKPYNYGWRQDDRFDVVEDA